MVRDIWTVILVAGVVCWIFSSIMLMFKAFPGKDVFDTSQGMRWGAVSGVSFFIWIIGMMNA